MLKDVIKSIGEDLMRILGPLNKTAGSKSLNNHTRFRPFLKKKALVILSNLNNYSKREKNNTLSICRKCNQSIGDKTLPLILWNKSQTHFIEFHVECIIKKEKLEDFVEFIDDFDYIYEIDY